MLKTRVDNLEKRQEALEEEHRGFESDYVTYRHFEAVVTPIQNMVKEIGQDIKKLLQMHSRNDRP